MDKNTRKLGEKKKRWKKRKQERIREGESLFFIPSEATEAPGGTSTRPGSIATSSNVHVSLVCIRPGGNGVRDLSQLEDESSRFANARISVVAVARKYHAAKGSSEVRQ